MYHQTHRPQWRYVSCFLKFPQEVIDFLCLGHEIRWPYQVLPSERSRFPDKGQKVLDIEHATDIVAISLVYRNTAVVVLYHTVDDRIEIILDIQVHNILSGSHDFLHRLVAETNDALKHALLILNFLLVGEFKSLFEVVDTKHVVLFLHYLLRKGPCAHEHGLHGPEEFSEHHESAHGKAAILQRVLPAVDFGHDFSEEQQEKSQDDRDTDESQPRRVSEVYDTVEDIIAQHDNGDVDQVVGDEDGGQRTFAVLPQCLYLLVGFSVLRVKCVEVGW